MTLLPFLIISTIAVAFALLMVTVRNAVHGALCLVVNFGAIAVFFFVLSAEFVGIVQIAVYAGAIMVLFLFVIMLLNIQGKEEKLADKPRGQLLTAALLGALLLAEIAVVGASTQGLSPGAPAAVSTAFGSPPSIGIQLFGMYLLPFEITSVLLLVAMVGAVVLAKRRL